MCVCVSFPIRFSCTNLEAGSNGRPEENIALEDIDAGEQFLYEVGGNIGGEGGREGGREGGVGK